MLGELADALVLLLPLAVIGVAAAVLHRQRASAQTVQLPPLRDDNQLDLPPPDQEEVADAPARQYGKKKAKNVEKKELRRRHNEWERKRQDEIERRRDLLAEERDKLDQAKEKARLKQEREENRRKEEELFHKQWIQTQLEQVKAQKQDVAEVKDKLLHLIKEKRVVDIKGLATQLDVRYSELLNTITEWDRSGTIMGVFSSKSQYVYVDPADVDQLQAELKSKGLLSMDDIKLLLHLDSSSISNLTGI